jgi:hypothetical protein
MKTKILGLICMLMAVSFFTSCSKDGDDDPIADVREDYVGSFRVNMEYIINGQQYTETYTLTIMKSSTNANDVILNNIINSNESVRATVSGNAMTIPQQTIGSSGLSGSGTLNNNVLSFSTLLTQTAGTQINIIQTGTKQ